ncbi:ArsC family reductase [Xanthobacter agilis]|jgi:arsenate reductase|uniref:Arsenate reductase n=1 Tax=Xanthobacter agilis TaxID=47492 RepID=A0ABU0LEU9_XANAG|nr:ArsC family reductase [Xanthobacter agilis]MDQ0505675.1 arsenate reductase [Xanthobacter agilis]
MTNAVTLYGIKACDTMKKARDWLDAHGVAYAFHDYKTQGIARAQLAGWVEKAGWPTLLNRAGTTFRKLPDADKADLDADKAIALMLAQPSMIKRPVLERADMILVGFKPEAYAAAFAGKTA